MIKIRYVFFSCYIPPPFFFLLSMMRQKYLGLIWKSKTTAEKQRKVVVAWLRPTQHGKALAPYSQAGDRSYGVSMSVRASAVNGDSWRVY